MLSLKILPRGTQSTQGCTIVSLGVPSALSGKNAGEAEGID